MKNLFFFDADCRIGSGPAIGIRPGVQELLADMDEYGVDNALVAHGNAPMLGAVQSNRELAEMLQQDTSARLQGVWSILPTQCHELPDPEAFFEEMRHNRIMALTLYPYDHLYLPSRLAIGPYMDMAREHHIPVMLRPLCEHWQELYDFVAAFPDNRLIFCETLGKPGRERLIRPLLEHFPNFYYGLSGYWVPEGIRDLAAFCSAEKILFASGYPQYVQGGSMLQLKYSGIPEREIRMIAGENLKNMLSEVK